MLAGLLAVQPAAGAGDQPAAGAAGLWWGPGQEQQWLRRCCLETPWLSPQAAVHSVPPDHRCHHPLSHQHTIYDRPSTSTLYLEGDIMKISLKNQEFFPFPTKCSFTGFF